jgi:hypothetical protein
VLTSTSGKKRRKGEISPLAGRSYRWRREREGLGGSLKSVTDDGVEPESVTGGARRSPLLWVANVWAAVDL